MRVATSQMNLSARAYHRNLKLAWTIADLAGGEDMQSAHLAEALQYRPKLMTRSFYEDRIDILMPDLSATRLIEPAARENLAADFLYADRTVLLSNCALIATTIVLMDISNAPTAGESRIPQLTSTPAASGMATMLYPAAHHKFWIILR